MEYSHESVGANGHAAIMGGYVYRYFGFAFNACYVYGLKFRIVRPEYNNSRIAGTYFFADLFGKTFSAKETSPGSGIFSQLKGSGNWECSKSSPTQCGPKIGLIFSLFEDNAGDSKGNVYGFLTILSDFFCSFF